MSTTNQSTDAISTRGFITKMCGGASVPARAPWRQIGIAWIGGCLISARSIARRVPTSVKLSGVKTQPRLRD